LVHDHTGGSGARSRQAQAYLVDPALDVDGEVQQNALIASEAITQDRGVHDPSEEATNAHGLESDSMPMDHSHMGSDNSPLAAVHHVHHMTTSMLLVERQHIWFMIVGLAIILFKFLADGEFFQTRAIPYIWPNWMVLLGVMLVFYKE